MNAPIRIGILGASAIAPSALIRPSRQVSGVEAYSVAARDPARARSYADRHGLAKVHDSYEALIDDPEVNAVYVPLPNSLHADWSIRALEAGKPVLCEKPMASNAAQAERMAEAADKTGQPLMEAFHWRYHPLADRMQQVIFSGRIGRVEHLEMDMCFPIPSPGDIRYQLALAGGSTMDMGCYCISILRFLTRAEPVVRQAEARLSSPGVDRYMRAELEFPDSISASFTAAMFAMTPPRLRLRVRGSEGEMKVTNPVAPHVFHRLKVKNAAGTTSETEPGRGSYTHQMEAFVNLIRNGTPIPTDARDGVKNMKAIDAVYEASGLGIRSGV